MKKVIFGLIILSVLLTLGYSQSITVTRPSAGEVVPKGSAYTIRWTTVGTLHASVKIRLFNSSGSSKIMDITDRTGTAAGSYRCPANLFNAVPDGSYIVRVKTLDDQYYDNSDVFILGDPVVDPGPVVEAEQKSITVVSPNNGKPLAWGSEIKILWRSNGPTESVEVILLRNSHIIGRISPPLHYGRISYLWKIGEFRGGTVDPGYGYKIRVSEIGSVVEDDSDNPFSIEEERNIDLYGWISSVRGSRMSRIVRVSAKVKCRNFPGSIENVPVKFTLKKKSDGIICNSVTETIPEITYRGHSYEYSVRARFGFRSCSEEFLSGEDFEVVMVIDPDDLFRDRSRLNNTVKKDVE
ncbi:MAG: Ser-Thr-rich GPI-anchored membrane family protein [Acidobacteriota bacterium]